MRIALQQGTVLALVEKEAGLLSAQPVDIESEAVFHCQRFTFIAQQIAVDRIETCLERQGGVAFVVYSAYARELCESLRYGGALHVHPHRVGLHHSRGAIEIHYEPGQEITFTVHQTHAIIVGSKQAESLAHVIGLLKAFREELRMECRCTEVQHAHRYGAHLPVPHAEGLSCG